MGGHVNSDLRDLVADLDVHCQFSVPLGSLTWYGVGGRAEVLAHPANTAQLTALVERCRDRRVRLYVFGHGANLLVSDGGVNGIVVQLDAPGFTDMSINGNRVTAGAGYDLMKLVLKTARAGLGGLEVVAGIPASIGGAVRMNAGGAFGEIGSAVGGVRVVADTGQLDAHDRDDLVFGYRWSNIVEPFIIEAQFELTPGDPVALMRRVKEIFLYKKSNQPMRASSAGCAFKNPVSVSGGGATAGQLIERAGLKGFTIGGASVSPLHANFVVVDQRSGRADDIKAVIDHVQMVVRDKFGVDLKREVVVWP